MLVPIDLASSSSPDDNSTGIVLPERVRLIAWRISYWLCFILTWAILPILQSYSDSGHRSHRKRIIAALRENARYHLTILSVGFVGLVYFFITSGINLYSLKGLLVALSYCYALFLAISLMGHGLVAIPRGLFQGSNIPGTLRKLQLKAPRAYDELVEAKNAMEAIEAEVAVVRQRKFNIRLEFQEWIEELVEMAQLSNYSSGNSRPRANVPPIITEEYLAGLTHRLRLCIHRRARFLSEWENLVQSAADIQSILDSKASRRLSFNKHFTSSTILENMDFLNPYTRYIFYFHILPYLRIALAGFLSIASGMVVWTELVYIWFPKLAVIRYTVVHHPSSLTGKIGLGGQLISAMWISYMCFAAYYSLSAVKVWGSYALVRRMTSASSACFYASYAARLTVPLAYNFVSFLPEENIVDKSVFYNFLGKLINLTAISEGFTNFFPILILLPVSASFFNVFGRLKAMLGFGGVDEDDSESDLAAGGWREGRDLIERELLGLSINSYGPRSRTPSGGIVGYGRSDVGIGVNRVSTTDTVRGAEPTLLAGRPGPLRVVGRYRDEPTNEEQDDGEGVWVGFVHRVRNTLDTVEPPRWLTDVASQKNRPKWLGGNQN